MAILKFYFKLTITCQTILKASLHSFLRDTNTTISEIPVDYAKNQTRISKAIFEI